MKRKIFLAALSILYMLANGFTHAQWKINTEAENNLANQEKTAVLKSTPGTNIIRNGSFNNDLSGTWELYLSTVEGLSGNMALIDNKCVISDIVLASEPVDWHLQLLQRFSSEQKEQMVIGTSYILSFEAFAENTRPCLIYLGLERDPWTSYLTENIEITTDTGYYNIEFTVEEILEDIKFSFNIGHDANTVTFDNIAIIKKSSELPAKQEVVASSGNFYANSSGSVSFTLGESLTTSLSQNNMVLTQGFQQAEIHVEPDYIYPDLNFEITVFPNPAHDYVILRTEQFTNLYYMLYTIEGKLIQQNKVVSTQTEIKFTMLPSSTYFLKIIQGNKEIKTCKIIKN